GIEEGGYVASATPTLRFDISDTTPVTVTCAVDGAEGPCSAEDSYTPAAPLADGEHQITVTATDSVDLTASATRTFTVDTLAPAVRLVGKPKRKSRKRKAVFKF